jgi:hypothetical protein
MDHPPRNAIPADEDASGPPVPDVPSEAEPGSSDTSAPTSADCPQCGSELSDPANLGWCLRCGYCRYLENAKAIEPLKPTPIDPEIQFYVDLFRALKKRFKRPAKADPEFDKLMDLLFAVEQQLGRAGLKIADIPECFDLLQTFARKMNEGEGSGDMNEYSDLMQLLSGKLKKEMGGTATQDRHRLLQLLAAPLPFLTLIPEWVAVLGCGLFIIAVGSFMAGSNLSDSPGVRFIWCALQAAAGVLTLFVGHILAFLTIVPRGLRLRKWTMLFLPNLLVSTLYYRLPLAPMPFWLLGWGLALEVGALVIVLMQS